MAYILEISTILILKRMGASNTQSIAISFWVGLVIAFVLQKIFAFKNKAEHKKILLKQAMLYGCLVLFNYFFALVFVAVTTQKIGVVFARTITIVLATLWNYYIYKKIIFHNT